MCCHVLVLCCGVLWSDVERTIMMLQEKDDETQQVIHKMETRGEVNVDEAVVPTAPLHKQ